MFLAMLRHVFANRRWINRRDPDQARAQCDARATGLLAETAIPDPGRVLESYAFQQSGGMNQRVMIAMALASRPKLLLADEPGTALDVTVQARVLRLLSDPRKERNLTYIFITHDLAVVRNVADRVAMFQSGELVESGRTQAIFSAPQSAYTRALIGAIPVVDARKPALRTALGARNYGDRDARAAVPARSHLCRARSEVRATIGARLFTLMVLDR